MQTLNPQIFTQQDDNYIIHFVSKILMDAIDKGASDIHFEPYKTTYQIRIRVDGILHHFTELSLELAQRITARLKVMSQLDVAERRLPQDGRFTLPHHSEQTRDCRISTCPTLFGEKIVVRILASNQLALDISHLGLEPEQQTLFMNALKKPQGMVLVTGPTGSGKTISLYTALQILNTAEKNISTVEDPIEIELPGINQINVHPKIGLDFATVLRALLRQDPDVMMVGEIRDPDTADIAVKAAQTGHFVLSTLHTNSTAEAINRLQMLGISTGNIAHSIQLIVAQRLLRKLCPHCKQPKLLLHPIPNDLELITQKPKTRHFFKAVGCELCMQGYSGRIGVFELLPMTEHMTELIINNQPALVLAKENERTGMLTLRQTAFKKVCQGLTSWQEMQRVVS